MKNHPDGEDAEARVFEYFRYLECFGIKTERTSHKHPVDILVTGRNFRIGIEVRDISNKNRERVITFRKQKRHKREWCQDNDFKLITVAVRGGEMRWKPGFKNFDFTRMFEMDVTPLQTLRSMRLGEPYDCKQGSKTVASR